VNQPPHEQLERAFSEVTRPPRPQLSERIRDSLWGRAGQVRRRRGLPVPLAGVVAAVVLVALIAAAVFEGETAVAGARRDLSRVAGLLSPQRTAARSGTPRATPAPAVASATPTATPAPAPTPTAAPTPSEPPPPTATPATAAPLSAPGYSCDAQSGGGGGRASMTTARAGAQKGYDRFVVQFSGPVPLFTVQLQASPTFAGVTLRGASGISVVLRNASGAGVFSGPTDVVPGLGTLSEAKLVSDSQGVVQWGIGLARPACFHAWVLGGPSRLVIDIVD
jgi:hypothetical protein